MTTKIPQPIIDGALAAAQRDLASQTPSAAVLPVVLPTPVPPPSRSTA